MTVKLKRLPPLFGKLPLRIVHRQFNQAEGLHTVLKADKTFCWHARDPVGQVHWGADPMPRQTDWTLLGTDAHASSKPTREKSSARRRAFLSVVRRLACLPLCRPLTARFLMQLLPLVNWSMGKKPKVSRGKGAGPCVLLCSQTCGKTRGADALRLLLPFVSRVIGKTRNWP